MFALRTLLCSLALAVPAFAQVTPTSPDSTTVVKVGQDIHALWTADGSGQWTDLEIQLMTGDNFQMVPLATLATGVDGTTTSSLDLACPDVSPYSKIYFLQFTRAGNVSTATWTTRFTIAGADGSSVPPTQETNNIQWGTGVLVGNASSVVGAGASNATTGSASSADLTASASPSASPSPSPSASSASVVPSDATNSTATSSTSSTSARASGASAAAAAASSTGAALRKSTVGLGAVVLGLAAAVAI